MNLWITVGVVGLLLALGPGAVHALPFADTVVSFTGGNGFGVLDQSGGSYGGSVGSGLFDPLAVTAGLDGAALALGGETGTPGSIVVKFSTGAVTDGTGNDLRVYDTFGFSEGLSVDASADGTTFFNIGSFGGSFPSSCSPTSPCATDFDLSPSGLGSASVFRITVVQGNLGSGGGCVTNYPECYDLDAVEALHFQTTVPAPASLALLALGLAGLGFWRRAVKK